MPHSALRPALLLLLAGCLAAGLGACGDDSTPTDTGVAPMDSATGDAGDAGDPGDAAPDAPVTGCGAADVGSEVVTVTTDDGVSLEADFYNIGTPGSGAAILLHMIPPSNDRSNYPADFIERLTTRGVAVINLNRRGAVAADGVDPVDAYAGPDGWLDAKAAFDFLAAHECGLDTSRIAVVGASNGTTTAFDFAVETATDPDRGPAALVFLTGGGYTENQRRIDDERAILDPLPIRFVYSTAEAAWSRGFEGGAPETWAFDEYADGDHGTLMFTAAPASMDRVADFVAAAVAP